MEVRLEPSPKMAQYLNDRPVAGAWGFRGARPPGLAPLASYGEGDRRSTSRVPLLVSILVLVLFVVVAVGEVGIRMIVVVHVLPAFADTQLGPQPVKVSAAAVVLELACHLYLLGLGSAAPHWLDPLEHAEP